jgi:chaperone required for assembly of F1-ATPase
MSAWKAKRFWKETKAAEVEGGFSVLLDGRSVKTPAKTPLVVPTMTMAQAIAAEWEAQEEEVQPLTMPVMRGANAALDKVTLQFDEVAAMLAEYGATDLLCYRAESPKELIERQAQAWDPILDWAATELGARLTSAQGVMFVSQDAVALEKLHELVRQMTPFELAAFHDLVGISGSLILGFAAIHNHLPIEQIWDLSRLDENWQIEQWGVDDEAAEQAAAKREEFLRAKRFYELCQHS